MSRNAEITVVVQQSGTVQKQVKFPIPSNSTTVPCSVVKHKLGQEYGSGSLSPAGSEDVRLLPGSQLEPSTQYMYKVFPAAGRALEQEWQEMKREVLALKLQLNCSTQEVLALKLQLNCSTQEVLALKLQLNGSTRTTHYNEEIAKAFVETAATLNVVDTLPELATQQLTSINTAVEGLVQRWREAGSSITTLEAAVRAKAGSAQVKEEPHMQPLAMELLDALGKAVGAKVIIADTHSTNPIGVGGSSGKIGCSLLSEDVRQWPYLMCPIEFNVNDIRPAQGQLITRCRRIFDAQPGRRFALAVAMTCSDVQLLQVHHNLDTGFISVEATHQLSLTDTKGELTAAAGGVSLLAQLLACDHDDHGFKEPDRPVAQEVAGRLLSEYTLVRPAGSASAPRAAVYCARWSPISSQSSCVQGMCATGGSSSSPNSSTNSYNRDVDEKSDEGRADDDCVDVIVKVGITDKEVELYRQMGQPAHCVQMKAVFNFEGDCRTSAILHPRCEVLGSAPDLQTLRRLGSDVAAAIQELYEAHIYHRDISRNNIGIYKGSGYLFDLSAGKDFGDDPEQRQSDTGHPRCFIGTPLYGAVCVLEGHPHSISSDLESLYYSLRHICYDELPDERTFECPISSTEWALTRRGAFTQPQVLPSGPYTEFMLQLHQLFWRNSGYWYDEKKVVTVKDFQDVCNGVAVGV